MTQAGMFLADSTAAPQQCPMSFDAVKEVEPVASGHRLMRVSEVAGAYPQSSPLASVLD